MTQIGSASKRQIGVTQVGSPRSVEPGHAIDRSGIGVTQTGSPQCCSGAKFTRLKFWTDFEAVGPVRPEHERFSVISLLFFLAFLVLEQGSSRP